jgi:hypothetical protein
MLSNAISNACLVSAKTYRKRKVVEIDGKGRISVTHQRLSSYWRQSHFWVEDVLPSGLPIFAIDKGSAPEVEAVKGMLDRLDLQVPIRYLNNAVPSMIGHAVFEAVHIVFVSGQVALEWSVSRYCAKDLLLAVRGQDSSGDGSKHALAYKTFMLDVFARTEQEYAWLGAYPWSTLEELLVSAEPLGVTMPIDDAKWEVFSNGMRRGWRCDRRSCWNQLKEWTVISLEMKHRHYLTIVTMLHAMGETWAVRDSHTKMFWRVSLQFLRDMLERGIGYERILLFLASVFSHRYWPVMAEFYLETGAHTLDLDGFLAVHKEITVVVSRTWMIPLTNTPHIASTYWNNMDNNVGYANTLPTSDSEEAILNIIQQVTNEQEYTFTDPVTGKRSAEGYAKAFRAHCYSLLEPMYREGMRNPQRWDDFVAARLANCGGGAAGSFATSFLGEVEANPQKKFAMGKLDKEAIDLYTWETITHFGIGSKLDERGPTRPIVGIDAFRALLASFAFSPIHNKYPHLGWDIGESPTQELARYLGLAGMSYTAAGFVGNDRPALAAYDFQKWDHYVQYAEQRIVKEVMLELSSTYILDDQVKTDICSALKKMIESHDAAVYTSSVFALEKFRLRLEEIVNNANAVPFKPKAGPEVEQGQRVKFVAPDSIFVANSATQQSGRWETLEGNTQLSRTRLALRDAEMSSVGVNAMTALLSFNRADDVAECYRSLYAAVESVNTMVRIGYKANVKKQIVSRRTVIYFRIIYANGTMRGMPARTIYSVVTGPPSKESGRLPHNVAIISAYAANAERAVRRGLEPSLMVRLYVEVSYYFAYISVATKLRGQFHITFTAAERKTLRAIGGTLYQGVLKFRIPRDVLEAAPVNGGLGILRPGLVNYDMGKKASRPLFPRIVSQLVRDLGAKATQGGPLPGVDDLANRAKEYMETSLGIKVPEGAVRRFHLDTQITAVGASGTGDINIARRRVSLMSMLRIPRRGGHCPTGSIMVEQRVLSAIQTVQNVFEDICYRKHDGSLCWEAIERALQGLRTPPAYGCLKKLWFGLGQYVARELRGEALEDFVRSVSLYAQTMRDLTAMLSTSLRSEDLLKYFMGEFEPETMTSKIIPAGLQGLSKGVFQQLLVRRLQEDPPRGNFKAWFELLEVEVMTAILRDLYAVLPNLLLN